MLQFVINATTQYLLYTIMINLPVVVSKYPSNIHKRAYARAKEEVLDTLVLWIFRYVLKYLQIGSVEDCQRL